MDIHRLSTGYPQRAWIDESCFLRYNVNVFINNFREKEIGFLSDSLAEGIERACDARNRGGIRRQRRAGERNGRPLSFLHLMNGKGYAFEGKKKSEWATQIGPYMVPERNISPSFQFFWGELTKRAVS